jgi:hypothetical protein
MGVRRHPVGSPRGPDPFLALWRALAPGFGFQGLVRSAALGRRLVSSGPAAAGARAASGLLAELHRRAPGESAGCPGMGPAEHPLRRHRAGGRFSQAVPTGDGIGAPLRRLQGPVIPVVRPAPPHGIAGESGPRQHLGPQPRGRHAALRVRLRPRGHPHPQRPRHLFRRPCQLLPTGPDQGPLHAELRLSARTGGCLPKRKSP